jgi:ABC-type antimicrobial peptide transport system permease subunit
VFRSSRSADVLPRIQERIRALGPDVPVYQVRSMEQIVSAAAAGPRFLAVLLGFFAIAAAMMAAAGLYGVVAYMVSRRTREFGIRLALGAPVSRIRTLVVARGVVLAAAGVVIGLAGSAVLALWLRDQLFATSPLDPAAMAIGIAVLAVVTAVAHLVPVARATRVSPTTALRAE